MMIPLRLRERPAEPGHGALLRLAARNGRHVVSSFATSLGVQLRDVLSGRDAMRVAGLAGLSPTAMAWWSPVISTPDRVVTIAGEELALGDWSITRRRHCPSCLLSDIEDAKRLGIPPEWLAHHRSYWDIRSVAACAIHGVALAETCPQCATPLGWRDSRRLTCSQCSSDLTVDPTRLEDPLGRYVSARLGVGSSDRPALLEDLPLRHAVRLCGKLGRAGLDAPPVGNTAGVPDIAFSVEGFRRVAMGIAGLDDVFDRMIARRSGDTPDGLGGAYGWLHDEWLGTDDPTATTYRQALRRHAVAHGVIAPDEERLGSNPPPTINLKQAAAEAGVAAQRMRRMLEDAGAIPPGSRRGVSFALDPGVVALAAKPRGAIRRAAREVLGIGRTALTGLADAGLIDVGSEDAFRSSAARLLAELGPQLCVGSPPPRTLPLTVATVAASVPLSRVVEILRQGGVPAWGDVDGVGLAAIRVRKVDMCPLRSKRDGYTGLAAAELLNLHPECVRALIRDGTLPRGSDGLIARATVDDFSASFVSGVHLARERNCSPTSLMAKLAATGIHPVWPLTTHRQAVFRWTDLGEPTRVVH